MFQVIEKPQKVNYRKWSDIYRFWKTDHHDQLSGVQCTRTPDPLHQSVMNSTIFTKA